MDNATPGVPAGKLARSLAAFRAGLFGRIGPEKCAAMRQAKAALEAADFRRRALGVGDEAPDFTLPDQNGDPVTLSEHLARGPVVLAFFRGGWCPFCTITLRAWQEVLPRLPARGASVLALSPEPVAGNAETAAQNLLHFPVLADQGMAVAERFGLVWELDPALRPFYLRLGHDLPRINGTGDWRLPLPATYLIGGDRRIRIAHVPPGPEERLEPEEALAALAGEAALSH